MPVILSLHRRAAAVLIAALLALMALTACGDDSSGGPAGASPTTAAAAAKHTVPDMSGNKVEVSTRPMRMVTNYPAVTQIIFLLGGIERQVGVTESSLTTLPLFKKIYPPLAKKTAVFGIDTTTVNTEVLLAQKPDLVFLAAGNDTLRGTIGKLGIPTLDVASFPNSDKLKAGVAFIVDVPGGDAPARAKKFTEVWARQGGGRAVTEGSKDDRWKSITAVRENHVLTNPRGVFVWAARSAESALQPLWVAKTLHPDRFKDVDIAKGIEDFYTTFYDYRLSDGEVEGILHPTTP